MECRTVDPTFVAAALVPVDPCWLYAPHTGCDCRDSDRTYNSFCEDVRSNVGLTAAVHLQGQHLRDWTGRETTSKPSQTWRLHGLLVRAWNELEADGPSLRTLATKCKLGRETAVSMIRAADVSL